MRILCLILGMLSALNVQAGQCSARSGERTAALVELYTSEGCSSCPPADRWLSTLGGRYGGRVVPLSLHVDYWDYIGWKDPYAKARFSMRQRKMSQLQRAAFVYTPQVLLQGRDFRAWGGAAFDAAVGEINARPARALIALGIDAVGKDRIQAEVQAQVRDPAQVDAVLYVAAYENKLVSQVAAGENRGRTLAHDYVVLEWQGPFPLNGGARLVQKQSLALLPKAVPENSGVAAFVQNRRTAEVLQALMLPACPG